MAAKDRPPSFQFYPRDFMADPSVQSLTWEQRGRYLWSLCCCWEQGLYGIAPEDSWRKWMRYGPAAWKRVRSLFADLYTQHPDEIWENSRMRSQRDEQIARSQSATIGGLVSAYKRGEMTEQTLSERLAIAGLSVRAIREQVESNAPTPASASAVASASASAPARKKEPRGEKRAAPLRVVKPFEITAEDEAHCGARTGLGAATVSILAERIRLEAADRGYKSGRSALLNWCKIEVERNGTNGAQVSGQAAADQWLRDNPDPEDACETPTS